ncbi:multidrug efflux pump acriflavin resistance protein AcrB/AcrD/AcrF [Ameyamaea chiangmaiensis NBRC 103196]|uniref:Efflux RND transporter permease subunit n=1 Tax=Ameyamaea chiangmaiensis TaxID=442969 RepID=A0A850PAX7_9PROT|nr:efflux RND transporter permease subunit [Ameyamaea chiangmaiensis]MBS4074443.1 efflux RND transporter permease subunit [Ameyamaea chiangmaiensis]NVN41098.1 efflux RND transporter permease subunit [Ameyamaea chiangmaiensis]GBQ72059.1 multidrug efflux pump acriflavin resistance protein AcrB/AcrD/AcrF [Ameyamaea chiangmaiensis NBRC 103196]
MNPSRLFIQRPVATSLLALAMLIAGIVGYRSLPVSDLPNVDFPVIMVMARQAGGTPEEIASTVAAPLERHLGAIADVTEMTSESTQNQARIMLQFDLSRDINGAARDVEAALQAAHADLPTTLRQNPSYFKANPNGAPILIMALTSPTRTSAQLYDLAENVLMQQLSQVSGVGEVEVGGSALPAVRVDLNPLKLFAYGIGFEDIRAALNSANAHTPKGFIEQNGTRFELDTNDQATNAQAYRDLVVAYHNSRAVRLSDVSTVTDSVEDLRNAGFFGSQRAVIAVVFPQAGANVIHTVDQIKAKMPLIRSALPPDVAVHEALDRSLTIRAALQDTQSTLVMSIILVVLVVLFFLRSGRSTLIPAIVVPTSIVATFAVMALLGYSLDNMSLMALTVSTGFVVDDAIVVLENISRYIEEGLPLREATLRGAQEVAFTVVSISVSLIAVFLPILLMGGVPGRLFHEFAMTMSTTILVSLVLSLTLTPMMCSVFLARVHTLPDPRSLRGRVHFGIERFLDATLRSYEHSLNAALRHRRLVALSLPFTVVLTIALFVKLPKGFFPTEDTGMLMGHLMGDQSISFQSMEKKMRYTQQQILKDPDVASVAGFIGGRGSSNQANLFVQLKDKSIRHDAVPDTMARIDKSLSNMVGAQFFAMEPGAIRVGARGGNAAYQYTLEGDSSAELFEWTPRLVSQLQKYPQFRNVSSDLQEGGSALAVAINRDQSARVSVTPQLVSQAVYDAYGQRSASVIYNALNQYHVVMGVGPMFWSDPSSLHQMWVSTSGGTASGATASNTIRVGTTSTATSSDSQSEASYRNQIQNALAGGSNTSSGSAVSTSSSTMVPLSFVSTIRPVTTALNVNHQGQSVAATISFNLAPGISLSDIGPLIEQASVAIHLPKTVHGEFAGNARQFQQSSNSTIILIVAALAAVYMTLGILYESYVHPLTILSTLPSAGVGALLALALFGEEFSLMAMIGVILLIGIVKKNAIMLVDFAIAAQRNEGLSPLEAIHRACLLRFRPIMMTSLAAALGAVPLMIGSGYGNELRRPLGIAIVGGLMVSQALTLYTTPVIYLYLERFGVWARSALRRVRLPRGPHTVTENS